MPIATRTRMTLFALLLLGTATAGAADVRGSADHPLLPRYQDAEIVRYEQHAFASHALLKAPARTHGGLQKNLSSTLPLEGRLTRISYRAPAERATLEVFRNIEQALQTAGFKPLFECAAEACGGRNFNLAASGGELYSLFGDYPQEQRYVASRLQRAEGDVYASVYVVFNKSGGGPNRHRAMVQLDVVELKPMEQRMVVLDAGDLQRKLDQEGRVAIYGILFDTDKDSMRSDSAAQLQQIAALLKRQPRLKVLVVGHTDAQGGMEHNRDLSTRRAQSIATALATQHGIDRARMTPIGIGMAAPVASNRSEAGRAQNRRVELVDITTSPLAR